MKITRYEDLPPIKIPFIALAYHPHTKEVEFHQKVSVQKGNEKQGERGVHSAAQLYGYLLKWIHTLQNDNYFKFSSAFM